MFQVNYQKRKNLELFNELSSEKILNLSEIQNYIPIYKKHFILNENNFNSVNLNHPKYLVKAIESLTNNSTNYKIKCVLNSTSIDVNVFFKLSPMMDPFKYLMNKYKNEIITLPKLNSTIETCPEKMLDMNNSAYIDGFFTYLSSILKNKFNFVNGIDYYGSYLSIKKNYKVNIFDDLEYLLESKSFIQNMNKTFTIDPEYDEIFKQHMLPSIKINEQSDDNNIEDFQFDDFNEDDDYETNKLNFKEFENFNKKNQIEENKESIVFTHLTEKNNEQNKNISDDNNYNDNYNDTDELSEYEYNDDSNTEYDTESESDADNYFKENNNDQEDDIEENENEENEENEENSTLTSSNESYVDEVLYATIPKFPVQIIAMECCEKTLDEYLMNNDITNEELLSILMQIVMTLLVYQSVFDLTHNDLHTNNIVYIHTTEKFLFYKYNGKVYRVPTYGKIFKIIDFGRSIYKLNNQIYCSDSFNYKTDGDSVGQYNCEPYVIPSKNIILPNKSFDLCRLGCSLFDNYFEPNEPISVCNDKNVFSSKRIIYEWCLDDDNVNILYKKSGEERYHDFKIYKMIARKVHNHTPENQLLRPEFDSFSKFKHPKKINNLIDIDLISLKI